MITIIILGLIISVTTIAVILMRKSKAPKNTISLNSNEWDITYSDGMPPHPTQETSGWSFDFPLLPNSLHYVTTKYNGAAKNLIRLKFQIQSNNAKFKALDNPSNLRATIRLFIQRKDDNMIRDGYRWWSTQGIYLTNIVTGILEIPLDYTLWTGLYGKHDANALKDTLNNLGNVGFTFGAQFYGHGVGLSEGSAKFTLIEFSIE